MCGEIQEKPSSDARSAQKARWSLCQGMSGKPDGVPVAELIQSVKDDWPGEFEGGMFVNRIRAALHHMHLNQTVEMVSPGVWRCVSESEPPKAAQEEESTESVPAGEAALYPMVQDQLHFWGECTRAEVLGGKLGVGKFGTPDVIGIISPNRTAKEYGFHHEILAVEVKDSITSDALFTGYGQASAYLSFAHKSFLVVPWCEGDSIQRVTWLCREKGIGLAFIISENNEEWLEIQFSPRSHKPDPDQLQEFVQRIEKSTDIDLFG